MFYLNKKINIYYFKTKSNKNLYNKKNAFDF